MRDSGCLDFLGTGSSLAFLGDGGGAKGPHLLLDVPMKSRGVVPGGTVVIVSVLSMEDPVVYAYK